MSFLDTPSDDVLLESPASFIIPEIRNACGDFRPAISLTEFLARYDLTCDETKSASVRDRNIGKNPIVFRAIFFVHLDFSKVHYFFVISNPGQHILCLISSCG